MKPIERNLVSVLLKRFSTSPNLIQVVVGPRQVGKTTALQQIIKKWQGPTLYASADLPAPPDAAWIQARWEAARQELKQNRKSTLLVLDEIQKIHRWSEVVKSLWDEDKRYKRPLRVALLGSASLHVRKGAEESLAGRFEIHFCPHWSYGECKKAFGWTLDQWIYFGGYPEGGKLASDHERWSQYILHSLIESVLSKDVLQMTSVLKPALLRQLFMLATRFPAQILSYNKMLGQLQDAGNTVTLAHYLNLLQSAFLVSGLQQWGGPLAKTRSSSPKFIVWNNALVSALSSFNLKSIRHQGDLWGRMVENAVGAHCLNYMTPGMNLYYWRRDSNEVDFVLEKGRSLMALEVKSGYLTRPSGFTPFLKIYPHAKPLVLGRDGLSLEKFFSIAPQDLF